MKAIIFLCVIIYATCIVDVFNFIHYDDTERSDWETKGYVSYRDSIADTTSVISHSEKQKVGYISKTEIMRERFTALIGLEIKLPMVSGCASWVPSFACKTADKPRGSGYFGACITTISTLHMERSRADKGLCMALNTASNTLEVHEASLLEKCSKDTLVKSSRVGFEWIDRPLRMVFEFNEDGAAMHLDTWRRSRRSTTTFRTEEDKQTIAIRGIEDWTKEGRYFMFSSMHAVAEETDSFTVYDYYTKIGFLN